MKVEYKVETKSESENSVRLCLEEVVRHASAEEFAGARTGSVVAVSSAGLNLLYHRGDRDYEAVRALPVGHRLVLEF